MEYKRQVALLENSLVEFGEPEREKVYDAVVGLLELIIPNSLKKPEVIAKLDDMIQFYRTHQGRSYTDATLTGDEELSLDDLEIMYADAVGMLDSVVKERGSPAGIVKCVRDVIQSATAETIQDVKDYLITVTYQPEFIEEEEIALDTDQDEQEEDKGFSFRSLFRK